MGLLDKIMGRVEDDDYDNDVYDEYEDDGADLSEAINSAAAKPPQRQVNTSGIPQYVLVRPERFDDSISIADHVISKKTVVLNLDSTGKELARRILDVLSGTAYAVGAQIKNVSVGTYLIIPRGAEFSGDDMDDIDTESFKF